MDETLKARLIGAAVLVALAVLLIPELLSGRKPPEPAGEGASGAKGTRTFTIELEGMPGQSARTPPASAPEPAALPRPEAPVESRAADSAPARAAAPAEPAKIPPAPTAPSVAGSGAPAAAPVARSEPPPAASRGGWSVQVGAFGTVDAARKLVKELEAAGYRAYVAPVTRSGKTLHRVRVGPEAARADAERLAARLAGRKLPAEVVAND